MRALDYAEILEGTVLVCSIRDMVLIRVSEPNTKQLIYLMRHTPARE